MRKHAKVYPGRLSHLSFFTRFEMAELPKLLMPHERILGVISGFHSAGTVLLAVTTNRVLFVDKKWVRLSYEDIRYESINEVNYSQQLVLASAKLYIMGRELTFKSWYKDELRMLVQLIQDKMFELRPVTNDSSGYKRVDVSSDQLTTQTGLYAPKTSTHTENTNLLPVVTAQVPKHVIDRVARWQRAARFVSDLPQA